MVTRRELLAHARRAGRHPRAAGGTEALARLHDVAAAGGDLPDEADPAAEVDALYRRALELVRGEFEGRTWAAFWAVVVDGRAAAEVAADLGVTPAAVRQAKSRVLRRFKEEVGDLTE